MAAFVAVVMVATYFASCLSAPPGQDVTNDLDGEVKLVGCNRRALKPQPAWILSNQTKTVHPERACVTLLEGSLTYVGCLFFPSGVRPVLVSEARKDISVQHCRRSLPQQPATENKK
jgi:hypothetical protein